ncbi:MAG: hypothetical protein IT323_09760 [Anaerolineae bacterium]|nr:hypothetical protein [Anaerolineae bacterium]
MDKTIARIERQAGIPGLVDVLAEGLSPTDLQSLLLEVYRRRAQSRQPAAVLADYEKNRFVRPSALSPLALVEWEQTAFASLPDSFEPVALSPVAPLGTCAAVALNDQRRVLSTARNTEVVSDSTNVLALECARRRRQIMQGDPKSPLAIHLAASHRLLRTQRYENPDLVPHFSAFALCSAGRDQGRLEWEFSALLTHIRFYCQAIRAYTRADTPLRVAVTPLSASAQRYAVVERLLSILQDQVVNAELVRDDQRTSGRGYYSDVCFHVYATTTDGRTLELADGGAVDWTQKLLGNAKERCVTSGIGSERVCAEFATPRGQAVR